jgi:hypothetical protein
MAGFFGGVSVIVGYPIKVHICMCVMVTQHAAVLSSILMQLLTYK